MTQLLVELTTNQHWLKGLGTRHSKVKSLSFLFLARSLLTRSSTIVVEIQLVALSTALNEVNKP